jgi:hypothetical protein
VSIGRRAPVKEATLTLAGDYEGWTCRVRTNPRFGVFDDLSSGDFARIGSALASICREWDFVDEDGEPLAQPGAGGVADLTSDLMAELMRVYTVHLSAATDLPKA